jgi:hypothetical protein
MLDFERLDVYVAALELVERSLRLADRLPRGFGPMAVRLRGNTDPRSPERKAG